MQMIMLEGAKATTETVDALRSGASAMKAIQKATYDACPVLRSGLCHKFLQSLCFYDMVAKEASVCLGNCTYVLATSHKLRNSFVSVADNSFLVHPLSS